MHFEKGKKKCELVLKYSNVLKLVSTRSMKMHFKVKTKKEKKKKKFTNRHYMLPVNCGETNMWNKMMPTKVLLQLL